jgi:hypothetical protein
MEESKMSQAPAGLEKAEIWKMLVETAHALPMYKNHKRYLEDVMIKEAPKISPQELAVQLNILVGEALVMLEEVRGGRLAKSEGRPDASIPKVSDRTLMDFRG